MPRGGRGSFGVHRFGVVRSIDDTGRALRRFVTLSVAEKRDPTTELKECSLERTRAKYGTPVVVGISVAACSGRFVVGMVRGWRDTAPTHKIVEQFPDHSLLN